MFQSIKSRDGRILDVLVAGDTESKTALVCHHGTPSDASIWSDWHQDALENNLLLVAISRPGYGLSDRSSGRTISTVAADVEDALDNLGADKSVSYTHLTLPTTPYV